MEFRSFKHLLKGKITMNYFDLTFIEQQLVRLKEIEENKLRDHHDDDFGNLFEEKKLSMYEAAKAFIEAFENEYERTKHIIDVQEAIACVKEAISDHKCCENGEE